MNVSINGVVFNLIQDNSTPKESTLVFGGPKGERLELTVNKSSLNHLVAVWQRDVEIKKLQAKVEEQESWDWNLYHDMDNRSYNDVQEIHKLTKALHDIENTAVCLPIADPVELVENIMKTTEEALKK